MDDLVPPLISAAVAVGVALFLNARTDARRRADQKVLDDQRRVDAEAARRGREADWVKEATLVLNAAAQRFIAAIERAAAETRDVRAEIDGVNRRAGVLEEVELPAARAKAERMEAARHAARDRSGDTARQVRSSAAAAVQAVAELGAEMERLGEERHELLEVVHHTFARHVHEARREWINAKGVMEVLAPGLREPVDALEGCIARYRDEYEFPMSRGRTSMDDLWAENAAFLAAARRQVDALTGGASDPEAGP